MPTLPSFRPNRRTLLRHALVFTAAMTAMAALLAADRGAAHLDFPALMACLIAASVIVTIATGLAPAHPASDVACMKAAPGAWDLQLVTEASDFVILIRPGGGVYVSPGLETLLGYPRASGAALTLRTILHPGDDITLSRIYASLSGEAPRASSSLRLRDKDGGTVFTEASLYRRIVGPHTFETLITIKNVTSRTREARALRLASEAARIAQAGADEANQAKSEFLARMSHEIRTPLNAVIGFGTLLLELPNLPPRARHYSERIKGAGRALLTIVDDILDFSEVEAGFVKIKPKPFALPLLIDECFSIIQHAALAKHLSLDVNLADRLPPGVLGDEARLRQILFNLLNNAIKFTHEGSVLLDIRYDETAPSKTRIKFSVTDTGIGIAPDDLSRLFQRFRQVDGTIRRTYGGTGLGLAISKQLVELMGGEIGVTSEKGIGSTFWFAVDLPPAPLVLQAREAQVYRPVRELRILLAEDVAINQELIGLMLAAGGHETDIVGTGAEAVEAIQNKAYDAILMDIQMPHMDGMTATRIIRGLAEPHRNVRIIAMTANVLPDQIERAKAAGMDDVLHKPFEAAELYAVLDRQTAKPAAPAGGPEPDLLDAAVLQKIESIVGGVKTKALLSMLAGSLEARFATDPGHAEGRLELRRDAHASVAGAGMLGFTVFSQHCHALEAAPEGAAFETALNKVRNEASRVSGCARRLSQARDDTGASAPMIRETA